MTSSQDTVCPQCARGTLYETHRTFQRTLKHDNREFQITANWVPARACNHCHEVFYDNRADNAIQVLLAQQIAAEQLKLEKCYEDLPSVMGVYLSGKYFHQFTLPTEVVVHSNHLLRPEEFTVGRAYMSDLQIAEDGVIGHRHVTDSVRGMEPHQHEPLLVVEVWHDNGDDGHTVYRHRGWMVARERDFKSRYKRYRDNTEVWNRDERDFLEFLGGLREEV